VKAGTAYWALWGRGVLEDSWSASSWCVPTATGWAVRGQAGSPGAGEAERAACRGGPAWKAAQLQRPPSGSPHALLGLCEQGRALSPPPAPPLPAARLGWAERGLAAVGLYRGGEMSECLFKWGTIWADLCPRGDEPRCSRQLLSPAQLRCCSPCPVPSHFPAAAAHPVPCPVPGVTAPPIGCHQGLWVRMPWCCPGHRTPQGHGPWAERLLLPPQAGVGCQSALGSLPSERPVGAVTGAVPQRCPMPPGPRVAAGLARSRCPARALYVCEDASRCSAGSGFH